MSGNFQKVADVADIEEGHAKVYEVAGRKLAVCKVEGQCFAIDDICTHDGGPLGEGELVDHQIECPRHGARFDVTNGKAMCLPAITPVCSYPVEIRNDEIWIAVPVLDGNACGKA
jgi:3-phenylpropionate/trans-cinnamate dioxygenase ferredoxin subunit